MVDRAWNANFMAGIVFGGCLSVACIVLALVVLLPMGNADWPPFIKGAVMMSVILFLVIGGIFVAAFLTTT